MAIKARVLSNKYSVPLSLPFTLSFRLLFAIPICAFSLHSLSRERLCSFSRKHRHAAHVACMHPSVDGNKDSVQGKRAVVLIKTLNQFLSPCLSFSLSSHFIRVSHIVQTTTKRAIYIAAERAPETAIINVRLGSAVLLFGLDTVLFGILNEEKPGGQLLCIVQCQRTHTHRSIQHFH